jgi:hypothetical protein
VEIASATLKKNESPSSDQIPAELIQAGGEILRSEIYVLINSIWSKEELSDRWKEYIIGPIYKKKKKKKNIKPPIVIIRGYRCYRLHAKF